MTTKRRATLAGSPDGPSKGHKRRKTSNFYVPETDETPEKTTELGLDVLTQIKESKDKYGRPVATEFLQLPDRKEHPQYYQAIRLPIALDTVEAKLKKHEYPSLTPVECDLRRMVTNAKYYNDKGSAIFSNAERIRKIVSAAMQSINPAYKDPDYVPFSTPLPEEDEEPPGPENEEAAGDQVTEEGEKASAQQTPATEGTDNPDYNFEGDSFQSAQEKILSGMIRLKDSDGEEVFFPFLNMPDRNLYSEYYDIIKHPVSLRTLLKRVRGTDGRKNPTKSTPFRTWQAFEEEVSYIWNNAREFNEDGSEIVLLAGSLKEYFHRILAEAKKVVPEPASTNGDATAAPRIKLRMGATKTPEPASQKLTLRLPGRGATQPTDVEHRLSEGSVDKQQEVHRPASNGLEAPERPTAPTRSLRDRSGSSRSARPPEQDQQRNAFGASPARPSVVKVEGTGASTPNLTRPASQEAAKPPQHQIFESPFNMPPPSSTGTPIQTNNSQSVIQAFAPRPSSYPSPAPVMPPMTMKLRKPGKEPLMTNVGIFTHPDLKIGHSLHLDIPASPTLMQQSVTINLPAKAHILCIAPTIASNSLQRQTQLSVSIGTQKLAPAASPSQPLDSSKPRYEARLGIGVTKIDIEVVANAPRGAAKPSGQEFDYERVTVYAHLMRG
ncbi:hypothetical protein FQN51_004067 [Onygenales sp. PD_10]|nr:hypothetical protein FQN51_004067 [Onygenales sp. PD_10]